jgi:hypothetical protein
MIAQTKEERWHFTKAQANAMYKKAIVTARKKPIQGIPESYMKVEVGGQGTFYRVCHLQNPSDRMRYERELWDKYGFKTISYSSQDGFYVRRA